MIQQKLNWFNYWWENLELRFDHGEYAGEKIVERLG